jgi:glycosyltransferase involved in cell wall biosynthesis
MRNACTDLPCDVLTSRLVWQKNRVRPNRRGDAGLASASSATMFRGETQMRIVLIADTFPPLRTSGAVQLRDLSREFVRQGHELTVLLPSAELEHAWALEAMKGLRVLRLRAPRTKDIGHVRRTLGELLMPFAMLWNLWRSPLAHARWDGVVWYSPSIFHGPLASALKRRSQCRSYLIIRDIFPEWARDMGLMGSGLPYRFFKAVARYQYSVADTIGVQTPGNLAYFEENGARRPMEVLQNWLAPASGAECSIRIADTALAGRKIFVYAGNMGIAQGIDILLDVAERLGNRNDVGFLFLGRGSEAKRLAAVAAERGLPNVLFHDEVDPDEIPAVYAQCHVGMVALDPRHKSHNIPGKFLTYMQSGLPVLANINRGNDLADVIREENVGSVCEDNSIDTLQRLAEELLERRVMDSAIPARCTALFARLFSTETAVKQVVASLQGAKQPTDRESQFPLAPAYQDGLIYSPHVAHRERQ